MRELINEALPAALLATAARSAALLSKKIGLLMSLELAEEVAGLAKEGHGEMALAGTVVVACPVGEEETCLEGDPSAILVGVG